MASSGNWPTTTAYVHYRQVLYLCTACLYYVYANKRRNIAKRNAEKSINNTAEVNRAFASVPRVKRVTSQKLFVKHLRKTRQATLSLPYPFPVHHSIRLSHMERVVTSQNLIEFFDGSRTKQSCSSRTCLAEPPSIAFLYVQRERERQMGEKRFPLA